MKLDQRDPLERTAHDDVNRIFNFSAGPAVLPRARARRGAARPGGAARRRHVGPRDQPPLEDVRGDPREGRGRHARARQACPSNYKVLFLQGGASPAVLDGADEPADRRRDRRLHRHRRLGAEGGQGSAAGRHGEHRRRRPKAENFTRIPRAGRAEADAERRLRAHHDEQHDRSAPSGTSEPDVGDVPLVADTSSDMFSRPIDVAKYGLIYAGAQKNLGPSGVTLVIIREDLLARSPKSLHTMLNYAVHAENGSMYNTPPCFGIYLMGLVMKWLLAEGGLDGDRRSTTSARPASSTPRSIAPASIAAPREKDSRSRMNVTFRLPSEELEKQVRQGIDRGRPRRPQGPPLGRRHARVDLQRVPGRRRRRARRVHAGVREEERLSFGGRSCPRPHAGALAPAPGASTIGNGIGA